MKAHKNTVYQVNYQTKDPYSPKDIHGIVSSTKIFDSSQEAKDFFDEIKNKGIWFTSNYNDQTFRAHVTKANLFKIVTQTDLLDEV